MNKADTTDTPACPRCPTGIGIPTNVTSDLRVITMTFTCGSCAHTWLDKRDDPLVFRRKSSAA